MDGYIDSNIIDRDIVEETEKLAAVLQGSKMYEEYKRYKTELQAEPLLLERVQVYKNAQMELESKRLQNGSVSFDEERRLAATYSELSLHPLAGAYLRLEYQMLQMYKRLFDVLTEACEIGLN